MSDITAALAPEKIVETIDRLSRRISERFPDSGLLNVCRRLLEISRQAKSRSAEIAKPLRATRWIVVVVTLLLLFGPLILMTLLRPPTEQVDAVEFVQVLEAGINDVVLIGAAIFFLVTLETRIKRRRALKALHELRSVAHVIDMHQLTKDPDVVLRPRRDTASSPKRTMSREELGRYLDYCSEMLSLAGKVAALYVQDFDDSVVLTSVNDLEELTTGLSRKIWQKIMILNSAPGEGRDAK